MEIIPVIDLLLGQVVRAQRGERSQYQPIRSPLCDSSDPVEVVRALLELYPFSSLYIADLDAILGTGSHFGTISMLRKSFPAIRLLLDAGMTQSHQIQNALDLGIQPVIGSERLDTLDQYATLLADTPPNSTLLSLDFNRKGFIGPAALLEQPESWPAEVICMTLSRVGSYAGPDTGILEQLLSIAGGRKVYGAGGVRNMQDIHDLQQRGLTGVMLASALHDGRINAAQIAGLSK